MHDDVREIARLHRRDLRRSTSRSTAIRRSPGCSPASSSPSTRPRARTCKPTAMRPVDAPFDVVRDHQLRLSARPEPLSGGEGHVGGGVHREAGRHDHLRRGVPRRRARRTGRTASCCASVSRRRRCSRWSRRRASPSRTAWQVQVQALIQRKARVMVKAGGLTPRAAPRGPLRAGHRRGHGGARGAGRGRTGRDDGGAAPRPADDSLSACDVTALRPDSPEYARPRHDCDAAQVDADLARPLRVVFTAAGDLGARLGLGRLHLAVGVDGPRHQRVRCRAPGSAPSTTTAPSRTCARGAASSGAPAATARRRPDLDRRDRHLAAPGRPG